MTVEPGADVKAGRREWVGLAVLALPCFLYSMDLTVLYLALPKLSADLQPSSTQLLWITSAATQCLPAFEATPMWLLLQ
jgi:hypothetical protein